MTIIEREKNKYRKNFNMLQTEYELGTSYRGDTPYRTGVFAGYRENYKADDRLYPTKKEPNYEVLPGVVMGLYYRNKLK